MGEVLLSTSRLNHCRRRGRLGPRRGGRRLADLLAALEEADRYYPPTPTFTGAFVGERSGNAAGAATFAMRTTRDRCRR
jgi:hypothetical protein